MQRFRKITLIVIIISSIALNNCFQGSGDEKANNQKNMKTLNDFMFFSQFFIQPEMFIYPQDGDTYVASDTNIEIYFSEPVEMLNDWSVTVNSSVYTKESPEITWDSIHLGDYKYPVLIIHPVKPLMRKAYTTVTVEGFIPEDAIGKFEKETSNFMVSGNELYLSVEPTTYSVPVKPDANVIVTFSERVDTSADWSITLDSVSYDNQSQETIWNDDRTVLTINPTGFFQRNRTIVASLTGFIAAYDGSPFPNSTSRFTITSGPSAAVSPSNGEKAVPLDSNIVITFTEPMVPDDGWSVAADGIVYTKDSPGITWNDSKTLTIVKAKNFSFLSTITIVIQGFHAAIDGYSFSGPLSISFKTGMKIENIPMNDSVYLSSRLSSAVDSAGKLYVGYYDRNRRCPVYITNKSGTWQDSVIDARQYFGYDTAIAIDSTDSLMAVYDDNWDDIATYATNKSGSWAVEQFDTGNNRGKGASISVDSLNAAHVSYWQTYSTDDILYATNRGGSWSIETIKTNYSSGGNNSSIAVDSNDKIHISYYADDNLHYATNIDGSWKTYIVDSSRYVGYNSVIAIDSNDAVYIAYYDTSDFYDNCIRYLTNKSGSWRRYKADSVFLTNRQISICTDSQNTVYISYIDFIQSEYKSFLKVAKIQSGICTVNYADSHERMGDNTTMVIDSNDAVHLFYTCGLDNTELRHATSAP